MYKIITTELFLKAYFKLTNTEEKKVDETLMKLGLSENAELETEEIKDNLFSSKVDNSTRIVWYFEDETTIALLSIYHHDKPNLLLSIAKSITTLSYFPL